MPTARASPESSLPGRGRPARVHSRSLTGWRLQRADRASFRSVVRDRLEAGERAGFDLAPLRSELPAGLARARQSCHGVHAMPGPSTGSGRAGSYPSRHADYPARLAALSDDAARRPARPGGCLAVLARPADRDRRGAGRDPESARSQARRFARALAGSRARDDRLGARAGDRCRGPSAGPSKAGRPVRRRVLACGHRPRRIRRSTAASPMRSTELPVPSISEVPLGTSPRKRDYFPLRNRIISGLCRRGPRRRSTRSRSGSLHHGPPRPRAGARGLRAARVRPKGPSRKAATRLLRAGRDRPVTRARATSSWTWASPWSPRVTGEGAATWRDDPVPGRSRPILRSQEALAGAVLDLLGAGPRVAGGDPRRTRRAAPERNRWSALLASRARGANSRGAGRPRSTGSLP